MARSVLSGNVQPSALARSLVQHLPLSTKRVRMPTSRAGHIRQPYKRPKKPVPVVHRRKEMEDVHAVSSDSPDTASSDSETPEARSSDSALSSGEYKLIRKRFLQNRRTRRCRRNARNRIRAQRRAALAQGS